MSEWTKHKWTNVRRPTLVNNIVFITVINKCISVVYVITNIVMWVIIIIFNDNNTWLRDHFGAWNCKTWVASVCQTDELCVCVYTTRDSDRPQAAITRRTSGKSEYLVYPSVSICTSWEVLLLAPLESHVGELV